MRDPETRASLIGRLDSPASEEAWAEFTGLYRPLIYRVARAKGLQHVDADDLAQDVLVAVSKAIGSFDVEAEGTLRGWLGTITRNLCVNHLTRQHGPIGSGDSSVQEMLKQEPDDNDTATMFRLELRRLKFRQAAERVRSEFSEDTWQSFWLTAVEQIPIEEVAERLQKTNGAVRVARCRVLARLKQSADDTSNTEY